MATLSATGADRKSEQSVPFHQITGSCTVISSIEITRFRGIREGKLEDLTPLVVLVGPNGCGKSSVLDALLIAANPVPGEAVVRTVRRHQGVEQGPAWLFWRAETQNPPEITVASAKNSLRKCRLNWETLSSEQEKHYDAMISGRKQGA